MFCKKAIVLVAITFLALTGCASQNGSFHPTYMQGAVPDWADRIVFESEDSQLIGKYLNQAKYADDLWLFWLKPDKLYINLDGSGVIVVNPGSKKIRWLEGEEEKEILKAISGKVSISNDVIKESAFKRVLSSVVSSLGQSYSGKITDNRQELKVVVATDEKRGGSGTNDELCSRAMLKVKLTDTQRNRRNLEWEYNCDWLIQATANVKVPQLLRKVQVSPSGKYYAYGERLYRAGGRSEEKLIDAYPLLSASINPDWTKIAVLRNKGNQYWIEVFNLKIDG